MVELAKKRHEAVARKKAELEALDEEIKRLQAVVERGELPKPEERAFPGGSAAMEKPEAEPQGCTLQSQPPGDVEQLRKMLEALNPLGKRKAVASDEKAAAPRQQRPTVGQDATQEAAAQDCEPIPKRPSRKASQIVPAIALLGLQFVDIVEMGYVRHMEIALAVMQLLCIAVQFWVLARITAEPDSGRKLRFPDKLGGPPTIQSAKEYDVTTWMEGVKQSIVVSVVAGGIYYSCGHISILVLQFLMTPLQLYEGPLFQIHILKKHIDRPFVTQNPFGWSGPPKPAAEEVEEGGEKKAK